MNEKISDNTERLSGIAADSIATLSGGAMLRKSREAAGLKIDALALSLKVPVNKLEDLEADRFDLLPDTVFVRALAASICRTLKVDATPILERLPHSTSPSLKTDESGINTPFRAAGAGSSFAFIAQLSKPLVFAVLALLIGAALLVFVPNKLPTVFVSQPKSEDVTLSLPMTSPASSAVTATNHVLVESVQALQSAAPVQPVSAPEAASTVTPNAPVATAVDVLPVSASSSAAIVFKARDTSWVEVVDARGTVQLRKNLTLGETIAVSGVLPLAVIVGRADNVDVLVRGQAFDLTRLAKDNVARFEVK